jgi:hypothetical protein
MDSRALGQKLLARIDEWPESWSHEAIDETFGRELIRALHPFLASLASSTLAKTTLRRHFGNSWLLGGEIVRAASQDPVLLRLEGPELLLRLVDEEGGPILSGDASEAEQRSFDSTCRKVFKFLTNEAGSA